MIFFLMKKAFFDGWDNLIRVVLLNLGFLVIIALIMTLPFLPFVTSLVMAFVLAIPGLLLFFLYLGFISHLLRDLSDYKTPEYKESFEVFKKNFKNYLFFGLINIVVIILTSISFPFYLRMGGIMGSLGAGLIFWVVFIWLGSIQYFFPLQSRMGGGIVKNIKKSVLFFLDNPGFSLFLMIYSLLLTALSVATAMLIPGITGVLLLHQDAVRLRLYKYDFLEEQGNPTSRGVKIPWDALMADDRESVGPRSLKGMIFPWKE